MNNINKLFSRLLLIIIPLYFTQGWLFDSGSITSQLLVGVWLLIDFYYMFAYLLKGKRNAVSNIIIVFWIVNLVYWFFSPKVVFSLDNRSFETFGDFKNISIVIISYFPFAYFQRKGVIDLKYLRRFFVIFLFAAIAAFMMKQEALLDEFGVYKTNNTAYYFVVLLPFLGVFWGDKKFWIWFIVITIFLLICVKRGAIICGFITYIVFLIMSNKNVPKNRLLSRFVGIIIFSIIIVVIVRYMFSTSDLLQSRMLATQEGDSSGRDRIYEGLWKLFSESSAIKKLFGYGMSQTVSFIGGYAHNDWLELLINEGIFGVFLYAAIFISFLSFYRSNKKYMVMGDRFRFIVAFLCLIFRTTFSMGYLAPESALFFIAMASGQKIMLKR